MSLGPVIVPYFSHITVRTMVWGAILEQWEHRKLQQRGLGPPTHFRDQIF